MVGRFDIGNAVDDLKDRLRKPVHDRKGVLLQVAEDWDVNPVLLERKFKETVGFTFEEYDLEEAIREAMSVALSKMTGDDLLFSLGQRTVIMPPNHGGKRVYIGGLGVRAINGEMVVIRSASPNIVNIIELASHAEHSGTITQIFGSLENFYREISGAKPSTIIPQEFRDWLEKPLIDPPLNDPGDPEAS